MRLLTIAIKMGFVEFLIIIFWKGGKTMEYHKPVIVAENKIDSLVKGPTCWDKQDSVITPRNCMYERD